MAEFDPVVNPTNEPSYLRDSRPIDVPNNPRPQGVEQNIIMPHGVKEGDRSAEYLGKAQEYGLNVDAQRTKSFSDLFGNIVQGADFLVKGVDTMFRRGIEKEVYAKTDINQDVEAIAILKNKVGGINSFLDANASMDQDNIPQDLEGLEGDVEALAGAQSASKISSTMYYGRLLSMAKDLRARYPGYRDYIDSTISKATGVNPANAFLTSLRQDVGRSMAGGNKEVNRTLQYITQNQELFGPIRASQIYRAVQTGQIGMPEVMDLARPAIVDKAKTDKMRRDFDTSKAADADLKLKGTNLLEHEVNRMVYSTVEGLTVNVGADTKMGMIDFLRNARQGKFKTADLEAAASNLENVALPKILNEGHRISMQTFPESGRSIVSTIGASSRNQTVDAAAENLKVIIRGLRSGKDGVGLVFDTVNHMQAERRDFENTVYSDPKLAPRLRLFGALDKFGGQAGVAAVSSLLQDSIIEGWDTQVTNWANDYIKQFATNAEKDGDMEYTDLNDMLKSAKKQRIPQQVQDTVLTRTMSLLGKAGVSPDMQANVAKALYGKGGFIEAQPKDGKDAYGNNIKGTYAKWAEMTRPESLEAMTALKPTHPRVYNDYVNWVTTTQRNLFQREIAELNGLRDDPRVKFGFSIKDNKFWVDDTGARGIAQRAETREMIAGRPTTPDSVARAKVLVARINMGMDPVIAIAKKEGKPAEDVTSYIIQKFQEGNLKVDLQTEGLPSKMYKELINAAQYQTTKETRGKKEMDVYEGNTPIPFSPTMRGPTVQEFVRDPFGSRGRESPLGSPQETVQAIQQQVAGEVAPTKERTSEAPKPSGRPSRRPIRDPHSMKDVVATEVIDIPPGVDVREYLREYDARKGR